jgi:6-phosphofructokinase 1
VPEVRGILPRGGTILGSSRTNPFKEDGGAERIAENLEADGVDGLIAIGGEDTLGVAARLHDEHGVHVVGVPKTIDNDLGATDYTFGFDTAVNIAMEAIDRLHTTADSHHRVLIVEVMGRHAAGSPSRRPRRRRQRDPDPGAAVRSRAGLRAGRPPLEARFAPIVVVSEGAQPRAAMPEPRDKGSTPSATSASAGSRTGSRGRSRARPARRRGRPCSGTSSAAARRPPSTGCSPPASACTRSTPPTPAVGTMTALRGTDIGLSQLSEATAELKTVPEELYEEAEVFFG